MKHWRFGLLGLVVSLLAIYFIVRQMDMARLGTALLHARYGYVLPTIILLVMGLVTRAVRWRVLLNNELRLQRAFSITNVSYLVNGVLPLRVGEVARVFLANRATPPVAVFKSASSIVVERMLDLMAVLLLLGFALATGPALPDVYRSAALLTMPLLIAAFLVLIVVASQRGLAQRLLARLTATVRVLRRWTLSAWLDHFLDGLAPLTRPRLLLSALFWTGLSWGFSVVAGYMLMFAFFEQASWSATALYIAAAAFAIAVPAVPGNIGTYEWAIMLALSALGYGEPTAPVIVSFAVVVHAVNLLVYVVMGMVGFFQEGITLGQLTSDVAEFSPNQEGYVNERTKA